MASIHIMNSKEKKQIVQILRDQFGFDKPLPYVFLINKKNRLFFVSEELSRIDFDSLRVNSYGIYIGELYNNNLRLSIEGSQLIGKQATKNVVELSEEQLEQWVQGLDIEFSENYTGFVLVKHGKDFYASGKTKEGKLLNYVPKARSLRVVNA